MNDTDPGTSKSTTQNHKQEHKTAQAKYDEKQPRVHVQTSMQESRLKYLYKWTLEKYEQNLWKSKVATVLCAQQCKANTNAAWQ